MKKYLNILVGAILCIVGLFCCCLQNYIANNHSQLAAILGNVASVVLISGLLTLLQDLIVKEYNENKLRELFGLSSSLTRSGLKTILTDCSEYHYTPVIEKSEKFSAVLNDGLRWVGNHSMSLEKRFNKKSTETEVFLVDPMGSFVNALAAKTSTDVNALINKIEQTISLLESTFKKSSKKGSLKIYYLRHYPTQTLFYSDDRVIVTPYQTSGGRSVIPLYEYAYEKGSVSIATHLIDDLVLVRQESKLVSEDGERCC